jgi:hypothetical protein
MQIIPFKEPAQWQEQIELDNQTFVLSFRWNAMNEYWVMDILTRDLVPIILGIKVVANYNLTAQYVNDGKPTGDIVCQNIIEGEGKIQRLDMGEITELIYYSLGEFV